MPIEALFLILTLILYFIMIGFQAVLSNLNYSREQLLGARDNLDSDSPMLARAKRANTNMAESLLLFIPLVMLVIIQERSTETSGLGAMIFFLTRATYAPLYWYGVPYVRTIAWFGGFVGIVMVGSALWPFWT